MADRRNTTTTEDRPDEPVDLTRGDAGRTGAEPDHPVIEQHTRDQDVDPGPKPPESAEPDHPVIEQHTRDQDVDPGPKPPESAEPEARTEETTTSEDPSTSRGDEVPATPDPSPPPAPQAPPITSLDEQTSDIDPADLDFAVERAPSITDLTGEAVDPDIGADRPDQLDQDLGLGDIATGHQESVLPGSSEPSDDGGDGLDPAPGGPAKAEDISDAIDFGIDRGDGEEPVFDAESALDADINPGNLTEHEQALFDELAEDPLDDPFSLDQGVPAEYDLSGNETGDGPGGDTPFVTRALNSLLKPAGGGEAEPGGNTNIKPFPQHKLGHNDEGYVALKDGETDPNLTTIGRARAGAIAKAEEEKKEEAGTDFGGGLGNWIASWFGGESEGAKAEAEAAAAAAKAEAEAAARAEAKAAAAAAEAEAKAADDDDGWEDMDRDPDSAPTPKSPTIDPEIGDTYFGIGVEAERNGAIQYADMPQSGNDGTREYDGVDYGEHHVEPDFDRTEAEAMLNGDPFTQPDVDPIEHQNSGADEGVDEMAIE